MRRRQPRRQSRRILADLVVQRILILYNMALERARSGDYEQASRLGLLIKELSMRTRIRIPRSVKRGLCKNCSLPLIPGVTSRVRLRSQGRFSYRVVTCSRCGWMHRYPYKG